MSSRFRQSPEEEAATSSKIRELLAQQVPVSAIRERLGLSHGTFKRLTRGINTKSHTRLPAGNP